MAKTSSEICYICKKPIAKGAEKGYVTAWGYFHKKCWNEKVPNWLSWQFPLYKRESQAEGMHLILFLVAAVLGMMLLLGGVMLFIEGRFSDLIAFVIIFFVLAIGVLPFIYGMRQALAEKK